MDEKTDNDESRNSEFKVLKYVEQTVEGTIRFVDSLFVTYFVLTFVPHRLGEYRTRRECHVPLVREYTLLTLSLFLLTASVITLVRIHGAELYPLAEESAKPQTVLPPVSFPQIFIFAIPQIVLLSWCSRLFAWFRCREPQIHGVYVSTVRYAGALQASILTLVVLILTLSVPQYVRLLLFWVLVLCSIAGPVVLLATSHLKLHGIRPSVRVLLSNASYSLLFSLVTAVVIFFSAILFAAIDAIPAYKSHSDNVMRIAEIVKHAVELSVPRKVNSASHGM